MRHLIPISAKLILRKPLYSPNKREYIKEKISVNDGTIHQQEEEKTKNNKTADSEIGLKYVIIHDSAEQVLTGKNLVAPLSKREK